MNQLTAFDLFSGCGGLTLGLKQAGYRVVGAVDVDPLAVRAYKANHPDVEVWETDIRKLGVSEVREKLRVAAGELDLLAGCPPCQGFSSIRRHNKAAAVDDPRNDLIYDFLRFVDGLRPKAVMLENVPGLANDRRLSDVCSMLRSIGYEDGHRILNAADYGVPQRRRRLILLAGRFGPIVFPTGTIRHLTVADAITGLPEAGSSDDALHDFPERRSHRIAALIKKIPADGGSRVALGSTNQLTCHQKVNGFHDIYGRMAWNRVAPTITSGCTNPSKGRFLHPEADRAITLREAALLQGFPRHYEFPLDQGKCAAAALIGNAMPPPFIREVASAVASYLAAHLGQEMNVYGGTGG